MKPDRYMAAYMLGHAVFLALVAKKCTKEPLECPSCGAILNVRTDELNGAVHINCSTPFCYQEQDLTVRK